MLSTFSPSFSTPPHSSPDPDSANGMAPATRPRPHRPTNGTGDPAEYPARRIIRRQRTGAGGVAGVVTNPSGRSLRLKEGNWEHNFALINLSETIFEQIGNKLFIE